MTTLLEEEERQVHSLLLDHWAACALEEGERGETH